VQRPDAPDGELVPVKALAEEFLGGPPRPQLRAFVTLVRFELAYYGLFKCNLRPLSAYPAVYDYLGRLLEMPAFAASVRPDHIKAGYYSIKALNPGGIIPAGPHLDFLPATWPDTDSAPVRRRSA
jgi:glutathionyl-hydroquinone reductase